MPFLESFFWFRFRNFVVFLGVRGGLRALFLGVSAELLFFPSGFLCAFLFVFSLLFALFWVPFWLWVHGRRAVLFSVGLSVCVSCLCFLFLSVFFDGPFLALGAGRRAAPFSVGLFVCVFVCVLSSFLTLFGFHVGSVVVVALVVPSGFCVLWCMCVCVFSSLLVGCLGFLFGSGCWAPCCSFFLRVFAVTFPKFFFFLRKRFFHFFDFWTIFWFFLSPAGKFHSHFCFTFHKGL